MAEFNKELDVKLGSVTVDSEKSRLTVGLFSYQEGAKKIQISRENKVGEDFRFSKLGRMSIEEAQDVAKAITKLTKDVR